MGRCPGPKWTRHPCSPNDWGKTYDSKLQRSDAASSSLPPFASIVAPLIAFKWPVAKTGFEKLSNKISAPFCQETEVHFFPWIKYPGTPKNNRNFHDPFLDEALRHLASACRKDLFFSSASSSAWWSADYWTKTSLSKKTTGRNTRDSTKCVSMVISHNIGPFPMPCWNHTRKPVDHKATTVRHTHTLMTQIRCAQPSSVQLLETSSSP